MTAIFKPNRKRVISPPKAVGKPAGFRVSREAPEGGFKHGFHGFNGLHEGNLKTIHEDSFDSSDSRSEASGGEHQNI